MPPIRLSRFLWIATGFSLAILLLPTSSRAQDSGIVDSSSVIDPSSQVITWDGSNGVVANSLVGADRLYALGVWGQATVTANVEAGRIWNGHETTTTLQDYYVAPGATGDFDAHATWVGSVIAAYDPLAPADNYPYYKMGMAPLTQFSSGAIATQWYGSGSFDITAKSFYSAYNHYFTQSWSRTINYGGGLSVQFSAPTDVINSSWGYGDATGKSDLTKAVDGMARAHPLTTLVVSAGNSNTPENSSNNVGGPASGFNSISVGAVGNGTYNEFGTVSEFSSRGPQDYSDPVHGLVVGVRAPVDIVAPGTSLAAAHYGGATGSNRPGLSTETADTATDLYNIVAGTSFAAPIVAGGVSLLKSVSYLADMTETSRDTRVIKSVLMNSATKLAGWDNGQHLDINTGVTVTTQSLDWAQGAGLLNLDKAFDQYYSGTQDVAGTGGGSISTFGWDYGTVQLDGYNDYAIHFTLQATAILDVTLSWFSNVGLPELGPDTLDPLDQTLTTQDLGFANLYLEIWNADFTHLFATSMSQYNSVQELHYVLPVDGEYGLRVHYAKQMYGDAVPEDYGLAWYANAPVEGVPEPGVFALSGVAGLVIVMFHRRKWKLCA